MCVLSHPGRDQGAEAEKPSTQGLCRLHLPGLRPQRVQHRRQVGHLQAHECHKWVFWLFHFNNNNNNKNTNLELLKKLSCAFTQPSLSLSFAINFLPSLLLHLSLSLTLPSRLTLPLRARCVSAQESLAVCLFLSLLKCLPFFFFEQGVGILLSSSHFLTSCNLSLSLPLLSSDGFFLCPLTLPLRFSSQPLRLLACLPLSVCLGFFLLFLLLRSRVRAVSCNSVVTLSVIFNSVCTPSVRLHAIAPATLLLRTTSLQLTTLIDWYTTREKPRAGAEDILFLLRCLYSLFYFPLLYMPASLNVC